MFVGVGLGRFAYTPIVPFLIQDGIGPIAGNYAGAANLTGYFLGAALAYRIGARVGPGRAVRGALVLTFVSFLACATPLGFAWLAFWRLVAGVTGAVLMILGASLMLSRVEAGARGRAAGVIMTGVGLGVILASAAIAPLADRSVRYVWFALAGLALIATAGSWRAWHEGPRALADPLPSGASGRFGPTILLIVFAYACDGAGFVPHTIFWVDYVARDLGLGPTWGTVSWLGFGIGAMVGPILVGVLADRLGLGRSLVLAFFVKAVAVALAIVTSAPLALTLSAFLVGALSPGLASLISARLHELVDRQSHGKAWGLATLGFSAAQAAGGLGMSSAFAATRSYPPIYGAGALLETVGLALAAWAWISARGR
ncbi:MAG TPA: YbfB/YjiJ family MFS transporter [Aliidongia sp.]|uniref:YbfB/YjiJ family MFS transporter n=1 Tax=Aliidongia sp. TaxID=1914230 RepID=UPI002DDD6EA0|nr:YbfB/YjiJ family MFS transporter [Aliidongia sp.]HEV2677833.1 YbfB/YjiJ family MFS transporter [Aliidongia sp.]